MLSAARRRFHVDGNLARRLLPNHGAEKRSGCLIEPSNWNKKDGAA